MAASPAFEAFRSACELPPAQLAAIASDLQAELRRGLAADGCALKMLPSHVVHLPSGAERGSWFALDLGGTNFRVLRLTLSEAAGAIEHVQSEEVAIPAELLAGTCAQLFAFIAARVVAFAGAEATGALGFTFSFACSQTALDAGTLLGWTKGFRLSDGPGLDVVALLRTALAARGSALSVAALVNDTVGTLAAARYADTRTSASVILGTGTNAAYLAPLASLTKLAAPPPGAPPHMIVNTEWGGFAGASLPRLPADEAVDAASANPRAQCFEKMVAGLYLGRVAAALLLQAEAEAPVLGPAAAAALARPDALPTPLLSRVANDASDDGADAAAALAEALGGPLSAPGLARCQEACSLVTRRAARLSAAGIAALLRHAGDTDATVAMDGGLFEHHAAFAAGVRACLAEQGLGATLRLTPDGSGVGAALIAAAAGKAV